MRAFRTSALVFPKWERDNALDRLNEKAANERNNMCDYERELAHLLFMDETQSWHVKQPTASICLADFYARGIKLCVSVTNNLDHVRKRLASMGFHVMKIDMRTTHPSEAAERIYHRAKVLRWIGERRKGLGSRKDSA